MDARLQERLELFRSMPSVPAGVVDAVEHELALLDDDHRIDDDSAGMLTSHLIAALGRALRQEPEIEPPAAELYAQVSAEAPGSINRAAASADRIGASLGISLPPAEKKYLAFHLAALTLTAARRTDDDRVAPVQSGSALHPESTTKSVSTTDAAPTSQETS